MDLLSRENKLFRKRSTSWSHECVCTQQPKAAAEWHLCFSLTCLQDDEIAYYNAKDNVSVLFFLPHICAASILAPCKHSALTQTLASNMFLLHRPQPLSHVLPFTSVSPPPPPPPLFRSPFTVHHIHISFIFASTASAPCGKLPLFCLFAGLFFQSSFPLHHPPPTPPPPPLRWGGFWHVSPLIDGWDVWAGYTVALLGSNRSCCLFRPFFFPLLYLLPLFCSLSLHISSSLSSYISMSALLSSMQIGERAYGAINLTKMERKQWLPFATSPPRRKWKEGEISLSIWMAGLYFFKRAGRLWKVQRWYYYVRRVDEDV